MKSPQRAISYAGLAFVGLAAVVAQGVIWPLAGRVERQLAEFHAALPAPTQLVLEARTGTSLLVFGLLVAAVLLHRHPRSTWLLVVCGLLELSIAGLYGWALWLPWQKPY